MYGATANVWSHRLRKKRPHHSVRAPQLLLRLLLHCPCFHKIFRNLQHLHSPFPWMESIFSFNSSSVRISSIVSSGRLEVFNPIFIGWPNIFIFFIFRKLKIKNRKIKKLKNIKVVTHGQKRTHNRQNRTTYISPDLRKA